MDLKAVECDGHIFMVDSEKIVLCDGKPARRRITTEGYIEVKKIREHRVMYLSKGKKIPNGYEVHHKDGTKSNNHPDNLSAISRSDHAKETGAQGVLSGDTTPVKVLVTLCVMPGRFDKGRIKDTAVMSAEFESEQSVKRSLGFKSDTSINKCLNGKRYFAYMPNSSRDYKYIFERR